MQEKKQEKKPRDTIFKILDIISRMVIIACMIVQLRINYRSFQRDLALQRQLNSVQEDVTEITNNHLEVLDRMNQCLRLMVDFLNNSDTQ